ncbi:MAG: VOC family protein, partial [Sphingobacterium sp.]
TQLYDEIPADPSHPPMPDDAKGKVMHTAIKIGNGTLIMGSDVVEGFGHRLTIGNSAYIMLDAESASEAQDLFTSLSVDSPEVEMALGETFFAELYSSFQDRFGVWWMVHFEGNKKMS